MDWGGLVCFEFWGGWAAGVGDGGVGFILLSFTV